MELSPLANLSSSSSGGMLPPRVAASASREAPRSSMSSTAVRPREAPRLDVPSSVDSPTTALRPRDMPLSIVATSMARSTTPLIPTERSPSSNEQAPVASSSAPLLDVSTLSATLPTPALSETATLPPISGASTSDSSALAEGLWSARLGDGTASSSSNRGPLPPPPGFRAMDLQRSLQQLLAADALPGLPNYPPSQLSTANQLTDVLRRLDSAVELATGAIRDANAEAVSVPSGSAPAPLTPPIETGTNDASPSTPPHDEIVNPAEPAADDDEDLIVTHEEVRAPAAVVAGASHDRSEEEDADDDDEDDDFVESTPSAIRPPLIPPGKKRSLADLIISSDNECPDDSYETLFLKMTKWLDSLNVSLQGADCLQNLQLSPSLFNDALNRVCTFGFAERVEKPFLVIKNSVLGSTKKLSPIFWIWFQNNPSSLKAEIVEALGTHPSSNMDDLTRKTVKFISLNCSDTAFVHVCLKVCRQWRDRVEISLLAKRSQKWKAASLYKEFDLLNIAKIAKK